MPDFRDLPEDLAQDVADYSRLGAEFLGLRLDDRPKAIIEAVTAFIRQRKEEGGTLEEEQIIGIGALIGQQYVRRFGWHWAMVNFDEDGDDDNYFACVLPADNSLSNNPIHWVRQTLKNPHSTNILLNFNMVESGVRPTVPNQAMGFY